jgi:hypothetical protein
MPKAKPLGAGAAAQRSCRFRIVEFWMLTLLPEFWITIGIPLIWPKAPSVMVLVPVVR